MSEVTSDLRIYIRHIRAIRNCSNGARGFFKKYGLNWTSFLSEGIEAEKLIETGDPRVAPVVQAALDEKEA